ncbi:12638_t:CDS:1, partial [Dentiscutata heterogama]
MIDNIIGNLSDTNETLSPLSVDSANWDDFVYHQSPEIASISNNNDGLLENFIFNQNFPTSLINNQPILTEVQQQNIWIENDFNNSHYYYDTNPTSQFDKNINDSFFEFPYSIDTGKL